MQQNHNIYQRVERYTGSQITTKQVHYSNKMQQEADTSLIKPRVKQSTHDLKHACEMAVITNSINVNDLARNKRNSRKSKR